MNESPLYKENSFITKEPEHKKLPTFDASREKLPIPIWDSHQDYIDAYYRAWEIAFSNLRAPISDTGFVSNFIDTAFNGHLFMWDSVFILMFGKYADRIFNFQGTLDNFYSHQHKDGFICRQIDEGTGEDVFARHDPSSTGPEVMAFCEWEYYLNFGDKDRLSKVFYPLLSYHNWMAENHTWPDGTYWSSGWGCGMDNLPRLMPSYSLCFSHGHMVWVDACMQELLNCNILIRMAKELGKEEYIATLEAERDMLSTVVNEKLWEEETGFYYDLWKNGKLNMVRHIGAYWALIAECAPKDRAEKMIALLSDENAFKSPTMIPSLSKDNEIYAAHGNYWQGGVWAPTNYMVLKGLDKYGKFSLSHEIAKNYLASVVDVYTKTNTFFENYAPEYIDGAPAKGEPAKKDFVGWTGIAPISILFEYVFGIKPDAANNRIVWDVNLLEEHGIRQYPFKNDGILTLICKERKSQDEKPEIIFESNVPLELEVIWGNDTNKHSTIIK